MNLTRKARKLANFSACALPRPLARMDLSEMKTISGFTILDTFVFFSFYLELDSILIRVLVFVWLAC